jgi:hypothetical protein
MKEMINFDLNLITEKNKVKNKEFTCIIEPINKISINNLNSFYYDSSIEEIDIKILAMIQHMYRIHVYDELILDIIKKKLNYKDSIRKNKNKFMPIFYGSIDVNIKNENVFHDATISIDTQLYYTSRLDSCLDKLKTIRISGELNDFIVENDLNEGDEKKQLNKVSISKYGENEKLMKYSNHVALFHTTPVKREYLILKEPIFVSCKTTEEIYNFLKETPYNNDCYLGTSESLVDVKLKFN